MVIAQILKQESLARNQTYRDVAAAETQHASKERTASISIAIKQMRPKLPMNRSKEFAKTVSAGMIDSSLELLFVLVYFQKILLYASLKTSITTFALWKGKARRKLHARLTYKPHAGNAIKSNVTTTKILSARTGRATMSGSPTRKVIATILISGEQFLSSPFAQSSEL